MVFIKMLVTADNGDNDLTLITEIMLMGVGRRRSRRSRNMMRSKMMTLIKLNTRVERSERESDEERSKADDRVSFRTSSIFTIFIFFVQI